LHVLCVKKLVFFSLRPLGLVIASQLRPGLSQTITYHVAIRAPAKAALAMTGIIIFLPPQEIRVKKIEE
jgi:hypothetical protein